MKILLVEDERKIANALKKGLMQESFAVDVQYNGDDGLSFAQDEEYDLIILDRMLPGKKDGIEIATILRQQKNNTPILMLTAKDKISDTVEGLNAGADDYLVKPFAFEELLARIRSLLRRPHQVINPVLSLANLTLNTQTYEVERAGKRISLTSKEFSLLEYLLRNKGRILSKESIMTHVWDYDADILPNTVEVYIGYLRSKIDRAFREHPPLIHTVRGFGYKVEADV